MTRIPTSKQPYLSEMIISIIAAIDRNNAIGKNNDLLWHLPADMSFFKRTTMGHCVLTGRKNYDSIPEKYKPLSGRTNIVLSRNPEFKPAGVHVFPTIASGISFARKKGENELFVIGGAQIYKQALETADKIYFTRVHAVFDADAFFPVWSPDDWQCQSSVFRAADDRNAYDMTFEEYVKRKFQ